MPRAKTGWGGGGGGGGGRGGGGLGERSGRLGAWCQGLKLVRVA